MTELCQRNQLKPFAEPAVPSDDEAIRYLKQSIAQGKHWYIALLEAIRLWTKAEEDYNGRKYRYLIGGEALDWLLLAERLCQEVVIPEDDLTDLLFFGKSPVELSKEEFKKQLLGQELANGLELFESIEQHRFHVTRNNSLFFFFTLSHGLIESFSSSRNSKLFFIKKAFYLKDNV